MSKKKLPVRNIINYVSVIVGLKVDEEGLFQWTREFEDRIVSVREIGEPKDWIIVEFADGSKYLKDLQNSMAYPVAPWETKPANPIGSHPDWEDYKADHIVGNEEYWDDEGEWNVFCADRGLA